MIEWAERYRNLQSTLLLSSVRLALAPHFVGVRVEGGRAASRMAPFWCFDGTPSTWPPSVFRSLPNQYFGSRGCQETGGEGAERLAALRRALRAFDVVGVLERFEETLLLVADAVGLQHLLYPAERPRTPWASPNASEIVYDARALGCENDAACASAIRAAAPIDHMMYAEVLAGFDAKVAALGAPFAARAASLKLAREERRQQEMRKASSVAKAIRSIRPRLARPAEKVAQGAASRQVECRGLVGGEGAHGEKLCSLVRADALFHMPWRQGR